jgi:hypothetical protein
MPGRVYTPEGFAELLRMHREAVKPLGMRAVEDMAEMVRVAAVTRSPGPEITKAIQKTTTDDSVTVGVSRPLAGNAAFVLTGTGIYGEMHREIRERRGRGMPMQVGGRTIFRRAQRGTPKNPFFEHAYDEASTLFPERVRLLGEAESDLENKGE